MKKEVKKGPKLVSKKVAMKRKLEAIIGKKVRFKSPDTGRMKVGYVYMVGESEVVLRGTKGEFVDTEWGNLFEAD